MILYLMIILIFLSSWKYLSERDAAAGREGGGGGGGGGQRAAVLRGLQGCSLILSAVVAGGCIGWGDESDDPQDSHGHWR
jgi:hypothetical protein